MLDMKRHLLTITTLFCLIIFSAGCDSDEPSVGPGEMELITRVALILTGAEENVIAVANDADGDGIDITVDTLRLMAGASYTGIITFEDGVNNENITEEVEEEADEHQVFYELKDDLGTKITIVATDQDGNGLPIGLQFAIQVTARTASEGTLNVVLSHYDDTPKDGVTKSDESDVDIDFPVKITEPSPS